MSYNPENFAAVPDSADNLPAFAQDRAQEALRAGRDYARANPIPVVLGALLIGVTVGMLCTRRDPKPQDAAKMARDLMEDAFAQITDRLPRLKHLETYPDNLRSKVADLGRKLRWW